MANNQANPVRGRGRGGRGGELISTSIFTQLARASVPDEVDLIKKYNQSLGLVQVRSSYGLNGLLHREYGVFEVASGKPQIKWLQPDEWSLRQAETIVKKSIVAGGSSGASGSLPGKGNRPKADDIQKVNLVKRLNKDPATDLNTLSDEEYKVLEMSASDLRDFAKTLNAGVNWRKERFLFDEETKTWSMLTDVKLFLGPAKGLESHFQT